MRSGGNRPPGATAPSAQSQRTTRPGLRAETESVQPANTPTDVHSIPQTQDTARKKPEVEVAHGKGAETGAVSAAAATEEEEEEEQEQGASTAAQEGAGAGVQGQGQEADVAAVATRNSPETWPDATRAQEQGQWPGLDAAAAMVAAADGMDLSSTEEGTPPPAVRESVPIPRYFGLIRHSERLDGLDEQGQSDALAREGTRCAWPDRHERPYDPPIVDWSLPAAQADTLQAFGITRMISSPFRRCLQTAGVLARALQLERVEVHRGLGEAMAMVQRCGWPSPEHELAYLPEDGMKGAWRINRPLVTMHD